MLPTFLVIGAAKCGTTTVCDLLSEHPDVFVAELKECHYFARDAFDELRPWYESLFEGGEHCEAVGEGSVLYTHPARIERAVSRMRQTIPDCRFVYMVRHPVRRLESDWKMRRIENRAPPDINAAIEEARDLVGIGKYWSNVSAYLRRFPREQLLVVFLEDFAAAPEEALSRILAHLGVDPDWVPDSVHRPRNTTKARRRAEAVGDLERLGIPIRKLKPFLPQPVRELGARLLATRRPEPEARWREDVLRDVERSLWDDARQLLSFVGKPEGFWDFESVVQRGSDTSDHAK